MMRRMSGSGDGGVFSQPGQQAEAGQHWPAGQHRTGPGFEPAVRVSLSPAAALWLLETGRQLLAWSVGTLTGLWGVSHVWSHR